MQTLPTIYSDQYQLRKLPLLKTDEEWLRNIDFLTIYGWLVGCFGFNGPLIQYFSLYRVDLTIYEYDGLTIYEYDYKIIESVLQKLVDFDKKILDSVTDNT